MTKEQIAAELAAFNAEAAARKARTPRARRAAERVARKEWMNSDEGQALVARLAAAPIVISTMTEVR